MISKVLCQPPLAQWTVAASAAAAPGRPRPVIATGHQAWLWHPGILAKDLAMRAAAQRLGADMVHLVVDSDVSDALTLPIPVRKGMRLMLETITLGTGMKLVPTGAQPALDAEDMASAVEQAAWKWGDQLLVDVTPLKRAITAAGRKEYPTLAAQMTAILRELAKPWLEDVRIVTVHDLTHTPAWGELVRRMIADSRGCATAYNQAVAAHPQAGVAPLRITEERIELPLWALPWGKQRLRVFAPGSSPGKGDLAPLIDEQQRPWTLEEITQGQGTTPARGWLAPKALALSALVRSSACDFFIHGKGGGVYDQAMEAWWAAWVGTPLAPMAVVSADVTLDFPMPLATREERDRAVWWDHYLPCNLDRVLTLKTKEAQRKSELLAHMHDDRDRHRRALAFTEIHRINQTWGAKHGAVLADARVKKEQARVGYANRELAQKRDWCLAWYPPAAMAELMQRLTEGG